MLLNYEYIHNSLPDFAAKENLLCPSKKVCSTKCWRRNVDLGRIIMLTFQNLKQRQSETRHCENAAWFQLLDDFTEHTD